MTEITFEFACRDDCLDKMVPSDLRVLVNQRDAALEELAALKSAVESSGDEIVRELTRVVFPSLRDYGQGYSAAVAERAAARITQDAQEKAALKAELASVKAHAEAMAKALDDGQNFGAWQPVVDAYRAAYPKE